VGSINFLDKLDFMMEKLGINKSKLSVLSGVPYTTIDTFYKKGYENTKLSTIKKISEALNVSMDYLIVDAITDEDYGKTNGFHVEYKEMEHIKKYRVLDEYGQEIVDSVLEIEYKRCAKLVEPMPRPEHFEQNQLLDLMNKDIADMTDEEYALYTQEVRRQAQEEIEAEEHSSDLPGSKMA